MRAVLGLLFFLALPFWEAKPPEKWTAFEVDTMLHASPWAQMVGPNPEVRIYLPTAKPIEEAEDEDRVRTRRPMVQPDPDYTDYLRQHREDDFVLAIDYSRPQNFGNAEDQRRMEEECEMLIGKKKHKIIGHFPPNTDDPVLRLIFPRVLQTADKSVVFRLFLPGLAFPEREVEFRVKDLMYHGKLEM
jgi:hypothetical protein